MRQRLVRIAKELGQAAVGIGYLIGALAILVAIFEVSLHLPISIAETLPVRSPGWWVCWVWCLGFPFWAGCLGVAFNAWKRWRDD